MVAAFLLAALFAPWIAPHDPSGANFLTSLTPPFWQEKGMLTYPLGTDNLGRDVLSRLIYGAQISLLISFFAIVIAGAVGVVLGLTAGYIGGWIDRKSTRLNSSH